MFRKDNTNPNYIHTELENMSILKSELELIIEKGTSANSELNKYKNIFEDISDEEELSEFSDSEEEEVDEGLEGYLYKPESDLSELKASNISFEL